MDRFRIRKAQLSDADTVVRFTAATFAEEDGISNLQFGAEQFRRDACGVPPAIEVWIAEDRAGAPCGQAIAYKGYDLERAARTMVLVNLYVEPEFRRDGLARVLIAQVCLRCMELGVHELTITTGIENAVARRFFEAIGARESARAQYMIEADEIEWLAAEAE